MCRLEFLFLSCQSNLTHFFCYLERKEAITRRSVERLNVGRQAGLEDDLKVEDFKVEAQGGGEQKVITKIDGPTAEAKEISPLLNTETSTKSKVRR